MSNLELRRISVYKDEVNESDTQYVVAIASKGCILAECTHLKEAKALQEALINTILNDRCNRLKARLCVYSVEEWNKL